MASLLTDFTYTKQITFDTTSNGANVSASQNNFPVCVHINSSSWTADERTHFATDNTLGKRVQFFDSDGTTNLDYEVEYYNGSTEAIYWVRVPTITGNSDTDYITIAYGNDPNSADQDNPTGVWDSNYKGVLHLNEASGNHTDTTGNYDGTRNNNTQVDGYIYKGQAFAGNDAAIIFATDAYNYANVTVSGWLYVPNTTAVTGCFFGITNNVDTDRLYIRANTTADTATTFQVYDDIDNRGGWLYSSGSYTTLPGWYYLTLSISSTGGKKLYVNGVVDIEDADTSAFDAIGTRYPSLGAYYYQSNWVVDLTGYIDEYRISNSARDANWVKLEYYSMKKTDYIGDNGASNSFVTFEAEVPMSANEIDLNDGVTLTDVVSVVVEGAGFGINVSDELTITENISETLITDIVISVSDQLNITESKIVAKEFYFPIGDAFTDTNGVLLQNHTVTALGGEWEYGYGSSTDYTILSNVLSTPGGSTSYYYNTAEPIDADYYVQATVSIAGASNYYNGVVGRASTTANTYYALQICGNTVISSLRELRLYKCVNGAVTLLDSYNHGSWSLGKTLKLVMNGSSIKGYMDGTLRVSATDSDITDKGYAGLMLNQSNFYIDDFSADYVTKEISVSDLISITTNFVDFWDTLYLNTNDNLSVSENINVIKETLTLSVYDPLTVTENITSNASLTDISIADQINITDNLDAYKFLSINVSDQVGITESNELFTNIYYINTSDHLVSLEEVTRFTSQIYISTSDNIHISEPWENVGYSIKRNKNLTIASSARRITRDISGKLWTTYIQSDGTYDQVYVANSSDNGVSWVEEKITTSSSNKAEPTMAIHPSNSLCVVYINGTKVESIRYVYGSWKNLEVINNTANVKSTPDLAVSHFDQYATVYAEAGVGIVFNYFNAASWYHDGKITISSGTAANRPTIVSDDQYFHIVWHELTGLYNQIFYRRYDFTENTFDDVVQLTSTAYSKNRPVIAVDNEGNLHCVWYGKDTGYTAVDNIWYSKYTDSWSTPEAITTETTYPQYSPTISATVDNRIHVVWYGKHADSTTYNQIRYREYTDSWQAIENITSTEFNNTNPVMLYAEKPYQNLAWERYSGNNDGLLSADSVAEPDYRLMSAPTTLYKDGYYWIYYYGRSTEEGTNRIIMRRSKDGLTEWSGKHIVLEPTGVEGDWDAYATVDPKITYYDGYFWLYYTMGAQDYETWQESVHSLRAGLAKSKDGFIFTRITNGIGGTNLVLESSENIDDKDYWGANPAKILSPDETTDGKFWLYFWCGSNNNDGTYAGLAKSDDGVNFTKIDNGINGTPIVFAPTGGTNWDAFGSGCRASVMKDGDRYVMMYRGGRSSGYAGSVSRYGVAFSDDGINWVRGIHNPVIPLGFDDWEDGYLPGPCVMWLEGDSNNKARFYYQGAYGADPTNRIGVAEQVEKDVWDTPSILPVKLKAGYGFIWLDAFGMRYYEKDAVFVDTNYSKGDSGSLPSNDTTLTVFTQAENGYVVYADDIRTELEFSDYGEFLMKNKSSGDDIALTPYAEIQSTLAPSSSTVYLQVYNRDTELWETLDSEDSANADEDFVLSGDVSSSLTDYYDSNYWISFRIYQDGGGSANTLKLDFWSLLELAIIQNDSIDLSENLLVSNNNLGDIDVASNLAISESVEMGAETFTEINDSVVLAEDISVEVNEGSPTIITEDDIEISESITLENNLNINVSDTLTITESITRSGTSGINVFDGLTITESITRLRTSFISKTETITLTESVTRSGQLYINVYDAITVSENFSPSPILGISVSDQLNLTEQVAVENENLGAISVADLVEITEQPIIDLGGELRQVVAGEDIVISEAVTTGNENLGGISVSEEITITEGVETAQESAVDVYDEITINTNLDEVNELNIAVSDSVVIDENLNESGALFVSVYDGIDITEGTESDMPYAVSVNDAVTITENNLAENEDLGGINTSDTIIIGEYNPLSGLTGAYDYILYRRTGGTWVRAGMVRNDHGTWMPVTDLRIKVGSAWRSVDTTG